MSAIHQDLAAGRWSQFSFLEQMANIGSEVERALELVDLTLDCVTGSARLKEIARLRESIVDYFSGENIYHSTRDSWTKYFSCFIYAARRNC